MIVELLFSVSIVTILIFAFLGCKSVLQRSEYVEIEGSDLELKPEIITKPETSGELTRYLEMTPGSDSESEV